MSRALWLGIFIFATLLILSTGIFLIGNKQFLFSPTYLLTANFKDVGGLDNGADVRLGGIHVGTVKQINLPADPSGAMTVEMKMQNSTRNVVRKDSTATIKTEGLLGDKYVEISFGTDKAEAIRDGDAIRGALPVDISELAVSTAEQARAGIASFQDNMDALKHNFLLRGYFDKRGYTDTIELTKSAIPRLPAATPFKRFDVPTNELFDNPNNAKLKNRKPLDEAGKFLEENKYGLVVIASSETLGDSDKARVLTEAQAKVVRDYIVQHFRVNDSRIKTIGLGKKIQPGDASEIQILIYSRLPSASPASDQAPQSK